MLYNHQPTFGIGLTPYHPFLKCSPEDLAKELFSGVEFKALSYDQVGSIMIPLLIKLKDSYDRLDKVGAMKKYCLKAYKDIKENLESIERNKEDLTSLQEDQNGNIKSKKRTRRGTRAGKLVKKRKTQSNILFSSYKSYDPLSSSDPVDLTKQNNILASSNNSCINSIIPQAFQYSTIGDHLVDKLISSIGKDISSSLEGFKTQEDTQNSFQSNQSSSILELISSNIPTSLSKSKKAKIRRKFRKLILSKKRISTITSNSNNVVDMLVENLPKADSLQQGNEPGLFYHLSRRYPSLPQVLYDFLTFLHFINKLKLMFLHRNLNYQKVNLKYPTSLLKFGNQVSQENKYQNILNAFVDMYLRSLISLVQIII